MQDVVIPEYLLIYIPVIVWLLSKLKSAITSEKVKGVIPLIALLGAVGLSLLAKEPDITWRAAILGGVLLGVGASGFYENIKDRTKVKK